MLLQTKRKLFLGLILFALGFLGMLSMLSMDLPIPEEILTVLQEDFTDQQIRWLILINPTFLLIASVVVGTILYQKVNLKVPIIEKLVGIRKEIYTLRDLVKSGIMGGLIAGSLIVLIVWIFNQLTPVEFEQLNQNLQPSLAARFLYGGITEEIFLRYGLMTLLVWIGTKIFRSQTDAPYWVAIAISTLLFAVGHFPVVFNTVDNPSLTLLTYVLIGNSIGGFIFGWLYWKKGLESAFLAHIFVHVVLVIAT